MELRPLHDRVLVRRLRGRNQNRWWNYYSRQFKKKNQLKVRVVAAGSGYTESRTVQVRALAVKAGDKDSFLKSLLGLKLKLDGSRIL
jgi:co-chaperonin GroES (HSP10)